MEGRDFNAIDSERLTRPLSQFAGRIRGGEGVGWTTVPATFSYYYFEWLVWEHFGEAIRRGEFKLVHRITPVSPIDDQRSGLAGRQPIRWPDAFTARVDFPFYSRGQPGFHFDQSRCPDCISANGPFPAFHSYVLHRKTPIAHAWKLRRLACEACQRTR